MKDWLSWYVFEPLGWQKATGYRVSMDHCRASIHEKGRFLASQCSKKPKITIEGLGFCTQHAKRIQLPADSK